MPCFEPVGYLLERRMPDGTEGILMMPDLATALADAARAAGEGEWTVLRISQGRGFVLEGEALVLALAEQRV